MLGVQLHCENECLTLTAIEVYHVHKSAPGADRGVQPVHSVDDAHCLPVNHDRRENRAAFRKPRDMTVVDAGQTGRVADRDIRNQNLVDIRCHDYVAAVRSLRHTFRVGS